MYAWEWYYNSDVLSVDRHIHRNCWAKFIESCFVNICHIYGCNGVIVITFETYSLDGQCIRWVVLCMFNIANGQPTDNSRVVVRSLSVLNPFCSVLVHNLSGTHVVHIRSYPAMVRLCSTMTDNQQTRYGRNNGYTDIYRTYTVRVPPEERSV